MQIIKNDIDHAMNLIKEELIADLSRLLIINKEKSSELSDSSKYNP